MFSGLNRIKFSKHPVQERKLNLFVDYYRFYTHFAGTLSTFELENPLSLVDKIAYQLKHNAHEQRCITYLKVHFSKLKEYTRKYTQNFSGYSAVVQNFDDWLAAGGTYPELKKNLESITKNVLALKDQLEKDLLAFSATELKQLILCPHPLEDHIKDIVFHARILASEVIFVRGNKNEAQELFDEIMSNDIRKFPFPQHIASIEDKITFIKKKTIIDTLEAINHFAEKKPLKWDINFKVENLTLPPDYIFNYGDTTIFPAHHPDKKILEKQLSNSKDPLIKNYFSGEEYSIAEVRVDSITHLGAHLNAVKILNYTLAYITQVMGQIPIVKTGNYLFSEDRQIYGHSFRLIRDRIAIDQYNRMKLEDNAYEFFRKNSSAAQDDFLMLEHGYVDAKGKMDISGMWQYLEVLLKNNGNIKRVKAYVSGAILLHEKQYRQPNLFNYLRNAIHTVNSNHKDIGLSIEEQVSFIRTGKDFKILNEKIKSDLFHLGYKELKTNVTKRWLQKQRMYYYFILQEGYEQRNFIQHGGMINARANTKLTYSFPIITARLRWVIFDFIKKYPSKKLSEILKLIQDGVEKMLGPFSAPS